MFNKNGLIVLSFFMCGTAWPASYHQNQRIPVPGDGKWDYLALDSDARRLYISHSTRVQVMDVDRQKIVGEISNTPGVHGIALAPKLNRGFISNGKEGTVTIFNLSTFQEIARVKAGMNPDAIVFDTATQRVFAFNGKSHDVTAIDAVTGNVLGQIPLAGKPEFAASDGQGALFVNLEDKSTLVHIDPQTLTVKELWPLAPCEEPSALTIDPINHRLFAGCHNRLMAIVDAATGRVITTVPIGNHVDAAVFDAEAHTILSSNGDGTLTVIHQDSPDRYHVVENVKTEPGARTVALDIKTHTLYLPNADLGTAVLPGTFHILVITLG